ncbi:MAG: molybdenum cofactor biosynthesis protein MoaE [Alphaproteobacteria bacterium]|nr:molybdenum cofactor biosynthesis protein MoaE [Alphaproteobacteria bacterium]
MAVRIQAADFDAGAEIAALTAGRDDIGAVVSFTGLVRGGEVSAMTLEHYPGMTERALEQIEAEANRRWPLKASLVVHRVGRLEPGANIVLVLTASEGRHAAFEAASFLMDYLKTDAPFWKSEERADGSTSWVDAREADDSAKTRWES